MLVHISNVKEQGLRNQMLTHRQDKQTSATLTHVCRGLIIIILSEGNYWPHAIQMCDLKGPYCIYVVLYELRASDTVKNDLLVSAFYT